ISLDKFWAIISETSATVRISAPTPFEATVGPLGSGSASSSSSTFGSSAGNEISSPSSPASTSLASGGHWPKPKLSSLGGCASSWFGGDPQRNATLQLPVLLAPPEAVPGLYLHPDHRRRRSRPPLRTQFNV